MLEKIILTKEISLVLSILGITAFLFIFTYIRVDVVAVLILGLIGICNLLPPELLFSGFSSEAVISLIAITIISAGLENAGISATVARWMLGVGKEQPKKISFLLMSIAGLLAGFMRSLGTVSLFLPIVSRINARIGISKSYLIMPIAFCSILGGTLTMVGSGPLILLNSVLSSSYKYISGGAELVYEPFELFDVLPIGIILLVSGIIYWIIARHKLTDQIQTTGYANRGAKAHFKQTYNKDTEIFELKVNSNCYFVDKSIRELETKLGEEAAILAVDQNKELHFPPLRKTILNSGATIAIMWSEDKITEFAKEYKITLHQKLQVFAELLHPVRSGLAEAVIPPDSQLIGTKVNELHMKRTHDVNVLALRRGNDIYSQDSLKDRTIRVGDTLGMFSQWSTLQEFQKNPDFVVLTSSYPKEKFLPKKMPIAIFFFILSIIFVVFKVFPISVGLFLGAIGMIATGVISIDKAYESVSWKTVFLLGGMLPLGVAMQTTGTADWLSNIIINLGFNIPSWAMLIFLTIITSILAVLITNIGAAIILIPIALELAIAVNANPKVYALTVALAASNTFLIPTHQVNALIAGPGGYSTKNFLFFGGIMSLIYIPVMLLGVYIFFI